MSLPRAEGIPVAGTVTGDPVTAGGDQLAGGDHARVLRRVRGLGDLRAGRTGRGQRLAALGRQAMGVEGVVEGPVEGWQAATDLGDV